MGQAAALRAGREGRARHHRPAQRHRAVAVARDLRRPTTAPLAPRGSEHDAERDGGRPAVRRRGRRRSGRSRRTPARRSCGPRLAPGPARATARSGARQTPMTLLRPSPPAEMSGLGELRHQRSRHDRRCRSRASGAARGTCPDRTAGAAPACRRPAAMAASRSRAPRTTTWSASRAATASCSRRLSSSTARPPAISSAWLRADRHEAVGGHVPGDDREMRARVAGAIALRAAGSDRACRR